MIFQDETHVYLYLNSRDYYIKASMELLSIIRQETFLSFYLGIDVINGIVVSLRVVVIMALIKVNQKVVCSYVNLLFGLIAI